MPRYRAFMRVEALQPLGEFYAADEAEALKRATQLSKKDNVIAAKRLEEITFKDVEVEED